MKQTINQAHNEPSRHNVKMQEGRFFLVRQSNYNGGCTEKVSWQVWERQPGRWKLNREYRTKRDAAHWLFVCADV